MRELFGAVKQRVKTGFRKLRKEFEERFKQINQPVPTQRDLSLDERAYQLKRKLGKGFFTRQLSSNYRAALIAGLTSHEKEIGRRMGWFN